MQAPALVKKTTGYRFLDWVERVGNKLPDPVTLFFVGAMLVLIGSAVAEWLGWSVQHPMDEDRTVEARSLLSRDGAQWIWLNMVSTFTSFHPLGVVLVAMLGIGVAEKSGLIAACLKGMVQITPAKLLTPAVIFVGVTSSVATDAGYVVLPPLAMLVFAKCGRSPVVGLAAVFAGVGGGFSANLLLTGLDPLLQGLTQASAQILDPSRTVRPECNWYFMIASTFLVTLVGWAVTAFVVEKRFTKQDVADQVAASNLPELMAGGDDKLSRTEIKGMLWALAVTVIACAGVAWMILAENGPLHGTYLKPTPANPDNQALIWPDTIVPLLFVLFLIPGIAYGIAVGTIRNDGDVAKMMGWAMSSMGMYIVLAFFAAQFVKWFDWSNMGFLTAITGADLLRKADMPPWMMIIAFIGVVALLNLFIGSASSKWAMISPVFVPMFMVLGFSPELTQVAYRVGDSCTNTIAPLNPYLPVVLVFMQRYMPRAGLGSLVALMLPYALTFLVVWTALLLLWVGLELPLGPGGTPMFIELTPQT
jgi:aminobenzoyl-glutamate transport protein